MTRAVRPPWIVAGLVLLFGCIPVRAAECGADGLQAMTSPAPYDYARGMDRARAILADVPDHADTILIGDSLVAFWPKEMAARQFRSGHVWNIGVGGAETQETLWLLDSIHASDLSPRRLFILVGTNNLTHETMPACAIAAGIEAVALAAHAKWPQATVDVMGIPPRGSDFRFRDKDRMAINSEVRAWSDRHPWLHFFEVDALTITCGGYASEPVEVAQAGNMPALRHRCANYADDFGHFRRPGYKVIFSAMTKNRASPHR